MNYGKIYIATKNWQTNSPVDDYKDGFVYFDLFGEKCRSAVLDKVVYHQVCGEWEPFDRAQDIVEIRAPEIISVERMRKR